MGCSPRAEETVKRGEYKWLFPKNARPNSASENGGHITRLGPSSHIRVHAAETRNNPIESVPNVVSTGTRRSSK